MKFHKLSAVLLGKTFIGIELFSLNNQERMSMLLVEKQKDELIISDREQSDYKVIFPERWKKNVPYFLILNTDQIIQKEVIGIEDVDDKLLHRSFPNINWNDFYFEILRLKAKSIIAICRKSQIDDLLLNYKKQGINIAGLSLGICSISEIITFLDNEIVTNTHLLSLNENDEILKNISNTNNSNYFLNGLEIDSKHLLEFSGLLKLITNKTQSNSGNLIFLNFNLLDFYKQQKFTSQGLKIIVSILFIILLVNFFVFTYYFKESQNTDSIYESNKTELQNAHKTKERIKIKEQKLKNVFDFSNSRSSEVINKIISLMPESVLLSELKYNPLEKTVKSDEPIITKNKLIIISGITQQNKDLTNWIEQIQNLTIIDEIMIVHFGKNDLDQNEFTIHLKTK